MEKQITTKIKTHFFGFFEKLKAGRIVKFSIEAKAFNPNEVKLVIYENDKIVASSEYHSGDGYFEKLSVQKKVGKGKVLKFGIEYKKEAIVDSVKIL